MDFSIVTELYNHHRQFYNMITPQGNPVAVRSHSPFSTKLQPQVNTNLLSYRFASSRHFIQTESYIMWASVSDFFHLAWCPQGLLLLEHVSVSSGHIIFHCMVNTSWLTPEFTSGPYSEQIFVSDVSLGPGSSLCSSTSSSSSAICWRVYLSSTEKIK